MKKIFIALLIVFTTISCSNDDEISTSSDNQVSLKINLVKLELDLFKKSNKTDKEATAKSISNWTHVFEDNLAIEFTNTTNSDVYSLPYDPSAPLQDYKITLPYGTYDYKLESVGNKFADFIPFIAQGTIVIASNTTNLDLVGVTNYGLVTIEQTNVSSATIGEDLGESNPVLEEAAFTQGHYYSYVLEGTDVIATATDELTSNLITLKLSTIESLNRYNLRLVRTDDLDVVSFILADFEQTDIIIGIGDGTEKVGYTYVPDDNFEQGLIDLGYDDVIDNYVLTENIKDIAYLNISNKNISDATGIEDFVGLTYLKLYKNQLTSIDVSKNTALTELVLEANQLTTIDVSENTALTRLSLQYNQLTALDVTKNIDLTFMSFGSNQLPTLDVTKNTALTQLFCNDNLLTTLDVSENTALSTLSCMKNQLTTLDASLNTVLSALACYDNKLTTLDVSENTFLTILDCEKNQLSSLDVTKNTELYRLECGDNELTALDVSKNTKLTNLHLTNNGLTGLDLTGNSILNYLYVENNDLTCIQITEAQLSTSLSGHWFKDDIASYSLECN